MLSRRFNLWSVAILGALNGVAFGSLVEAVIHAYVWLVNRRMRKLASGDEFICPVEYPPNWWLTPCLFLVVFAGAAVVVHRFWPGAAPSVPRLWQKVALAGSVAVVFYALAYDYFVRGAVNPKAAAAYALLIVPAAGFNYVFGVFVRMVADYHAQGKRAALL